MCERHHTVGEEAGNDWAPRLTHLQQPSLQQCAQSVSYKHRLSREKLMNNEVKQEVGGGTLAGRKESGK